MGNQSQPAEDTPRKGKPAVQEAPVNPDRGQQRPGEAMPEDAAPASYTSAITDKDRARYAKYARRRAANPVAP